MKFNWVSRRYSRKGICLSHAVRVDMVERIVNIWKINKQRIRKNIYREATKAASIKKNIFAFAFPSYIQLPFIERGEHAFTADVHVNSLDFGLWHDVYNILSSSPSPRARCERRSVFFLYSLCRYTQKRENYYAIVVVAKVYNVCDPIREVEKFQYFYFICCWLDYFTHPLNLAQKTSLFALPSTC